MDVLALISRKQTGKSITKSQVCDLVAAVMADTVPDYQLAALLMAIYYEGLSYEETLALTQAFVDSGETLTWPELPAPVVDKHSTGGVGDKVSLVLVPWLAAAGLCVVKMSGRGLGHTGGTVDKLQSIPGFRVELPASELQHLLSEVGCAIVSSSANLVPADRRFYALRDVTGTVDELGLIAASVLSKKIAAGAQHIVLDVKCGNGAFFQRRDRAQRFADLVIGLGREFGRQVACIISNMDQPLGYAVGNALEVQEAAQFLQGESVPPDLQELCLSLGAVVLQLAGRVQNLAEGKEELAGLLADSTVYARFKDWIAAQSGDWGSFNQLLVNLKDYRCIEVDSVAEGYIEMIDAKRVGEFARTLGAGRLTAEDKVDPFVGIVFARKLGDRVARGDRLATIYAKPDDPRADAEIAAELQAAFGLGGNPVATGPVVLDIMSQ